MKLVQVCPMFSYFGGVEHHVSEISKRLQKARVDVEVFTTDPTGKLPRRGQVDGIPLRRFRSFAPNNAYFFAPELYFALKRLRNVDLVHTHSYQAYPSLAVALAKKENKIPIVFTPHYHPMGGTFLRSFLKRVYRTIGSYIFKKADAIIAVSKYEQNLLAQSFEDGTDKVVCIPNAVDAKKFNYVNSAPKSSKKKSVLYVGRLEKYKGIEFLMEAFRMARERCPLLELNIVGSGPYEPKLISIAENLKINENLHFIGNVPESTLLWIYASSDVFVMPSQYEAFCISLIEAMASGLPVIATKVGGIPEVVQNGCNGFLIDYPPNHHELSELIIHLIEHEDFALQIGTNARKMASTLFSWDNVVERLLRLYKKVENCK